jgi:hypothetical protein
MRRSLRLVLLVLSAVFVAVACYRLATRWESGKVNVSFAWLALSCLPMAAGCVIQAASWRWLMERMVHRSIPLRPTLQLHFESQMARYTPGKVGMPLVRMAGAERLGVPAAVAGYSVLTESISLVAMGGVVGFALLALTSGGASGMLAALGQLGVFGLGAFVLITLVLVLLDRRHYPSWLVSALHAEGTGPLVPLRAPFTHAAYWLTWAVHGYLAARAVGISSEHALAGSGLYVLAPIAGILALATPSGLGVREAVLSLGLSPFVGAAPAVAAALVSRAISLLVDVLMWLLGRALLR